MLEEVRNAERVRPDQIPLPSEMPPQSASQKPPAPPSHGILKKLPSIITTTSSGEMKISFRAIKSAPDPPPISPPELSDSDDDQSSTSSGSESSFDSVSPASSSSESSTDDENLKKDTRSPRKSIRFANDVEIESSKDSRLTVDRDRQRNKLSEMEGDEAPYDPEQPFESEKPQTSSHIQPVIGGFVPPPFPPPPLPVMSQRMPPVPYGMPGLSSQPSVPGNVRRLPGGRLVLDGGSSVVQAPASKSNFQRGGAKGPDTSIASSSALHQMAPPPVDSKVTTIERKAQIKNLLQESTKFVPSQLKVRREFKDAHGRIIRPSAPKPSQQAYSFQNQTSSVAPGTSNPASKPSEKEETYAQFMKSLDEFL